MPSTAWHAALLARHALRPWLQVCSLSHEPWRCMTFEKACFTTTLPLPAFPDMAACPAVCPL